MKRDIIVIMNLEWKGGYRDNSTVITVEGVKQVRRKPLCAALCLSAALCASPVFAGEVFTDTSGHWASEQIRTWADRNIVSGYDGKFRPNAPITRGEAATIVNNIMHYPTAAKTPFTDLAAEKFYAQSVLKLAHAGVMSGYPDGTFRGESPITRQEAVTMLANAFRIPITEGETELAYKDSEKIAPYALKFVQIFTSRGYVSGDPDGNFRPASEITRGEFLAILQNMVSEVQPIDGTNASSVEGILLINQPGVTLTNKTVDTLFVAAGVGDGEVTLRDVTADTVYVQGGGVNSILIEGNSRIRSIQISKQDSGVRILVTGNAQVEITHILDGCNDIILSGSFQTIAIDSSSNYIQLVGATVQNMTVTGAGVNITIDRTSKVDTLAVAESANNANIKSDGKIGSVHVDNPSVQVTTPGSSGSGGGSSGGGGSSSGGGGSSGGNNQPDEPGQTIFGLTLFVSRGGYAFAEEVTDGQVTPPGDPKPPVVDPIDPEKDGYPLVIQTGGHGIAIAEEFVEEVPEPEKPAEPEEYIARIEVIGQGTIIVEEVGG